MNLRLLISTLIFLSFHLTQTPHATAHPQAFREEMSKYDIIFDKVKPEIMAMGKDELDAFRIYLSTCGAGKNWTVDSLPFFQCMKEELNYVIEFSKSDRTLEQVLMWLDKDRQKASEGDEMRKTALQQIEGYLESWVRARYHELRQPN
mgnify:CR=1 FL=1